MFSWKRVFIFIPALSIFCLIAYSISGASGKSTSKPFTQIRMIKISPGKFMMGSPVDEPGRYKENLHEVELTRAFEMMETEVTASVFESAMGYNPTTFPQCGGDCPVVNVSWFDAVSFANRYSEMNGLLPCYEITGIQCTHPTDGSFAKDCRDQGGISRAKVKTTGATTVYDCPGFRLPTEAEWEYAARAGTQTAFSSGQMTFENCDPLDPALDRIGWYCGNSGRTLHRVKLKKPNPWGLYDMSGNTREWIWDVLIGYPDGAAQAPVAPGDGRFRVVRGGGWERPARHCRSAFRGNDPPGFRNGDVGIRLVRTLVRL